MRFPTLLVALMLGALPMAATAGDSPEIPYDKLVEWMPKLLEARAAFGELQQSLCGSAEPSFQAISDSKALELLAQLRLVSKEAETMPTHLLRYEDLLDGEPASAQQRYREGMASAQILEPQLEGLGESVKKARSAVRKCKDEETARIACERMSALNTLLEGIDVGVFATAGNAAAEPRKAAKVKRSKKSKLSSDEHQRRYGCPPCPCSDDGNCAPCPPCNASDGPQF